MMQFIRTILSRRTDEGASAVEYGLLVAGIAAVIVIAVFGIGKLVGGAFHDTCSTIQTNQAATATGHDATC